MMPGAVPLGELGIAARFSEGRVTLYVQGEIDLLTAPDLDAMVEAAAGRGPQEMVVDLGEVTFLGAQGLRSIAAGAARLAPGGRLTVSRPSRLVRRLMGITGIDQVVHVEGARAERDHLGPEQSPGEAESPSGAEAVELSEMLRRTLAGPADDDVVDAALGLVVALAGATVGGADGVSVSLQRHGRLATVAASDATVSEMDAGQYATGEGPCVAASVEGRWFHAESLEDEARWPAFTVPNH